MRALPALASSSPTLCRQEHPSPAPSFPASVPFNLLKTPLPTHFLLHSPDRPAPPTRGLDPVPLSLAAPRPAPSTGPSALSQVPRNPAPTPRLPLATSCPEPHRWVPHAPVGLLPTVSPWASLSPRTAPDSVLFQEAPKARNLILIIVHACS